MGVAPLLLQVKSYLQFAMPHKISQNLAVPADGVLETADLWHFCPVEAWYTAGVWWNLSPTHYFRAMDGFICHYVLPQYNVHGNYYLGNQTVVPYATSPASCAEQSIPFEHYFYHGSIGYYSLYGEVRGTYCLEDKTAYVLVGALGTYDVNGPPLANDRGSPGYRNSYWYCITGAIWILFRCSILRRSYVSCSRLAKQCDNVGTVIRLDHAMVYVQESMRLSAHGARNYHRVALVYLLVEGLMSDLFLLTTQEGIMGRVQCISLGYNLAGIMSMLFEMVEVMGWMRESARCVLKRILFNYETVLVGELICAAAMQYYASAVNHSKLKEWRPEAEAVSYYVMSLVGHSVIVLGCVFVIISARVLGALGFVRWKFGCLTVLTAPCCVDTVLGVRCKLTKLGGYSWDNGRLFYTVEALKAFGLMKMVEEDGDEFMALHKLYWFVIPRDDVFVIGTISNQSVVSCAERPCTGIVSAFGQRLGGVTGCNRRIQVLPRGFSSH